MSRYAIYAAEQLYGGEHGMCSYLVVEALNNEEAIDWAIQESRDIIDSYECIGDDLEEDVSYYYDKEENPEEFEQALEERIQNDLEWAVWKINEEKANKYDTQTLGEMIYNTPEDFIEEYCINL